MGQELTHSGTWATCVTHVRIKYTHLSYKITSFTFNSNLKRKDIQRMHRIYNSVPANKYSRLLISSVISTASFQHTEIKPERIKGPLLLMLLGLRRSNSTSKSSQQSYTILCLLKQRTTCSLMFFTNH